MFHGLWQLTKLTLTVDSRKSGLHAIRLGLAVVLYFAVCYTQAFSMRAATGLPIFQTQVAITAFFISMNAIFRNSQAISEEREDDTLGLIRLADIGPLSIILAKLAGILCDSSLLIVIQFPFTISAITLGGVSWPQVFAAYTALLAYLWLLATISIANSVFSLTGGVAARRTGSFVVIYALPPCLFFVLPIGFPAWTSILLPVLRFVCLPTRLIEITDSAFAESPWCSSVFLALVAGAMCLLGAWWAFDRVTLREDAPRLPLHRNRERNSSRRCWSRPVIWREFLFEMGGWQWVTGRLFVHLAIMAVVFYMTTSIGFGFAWSSIWCGLFGLIDGSWSASRLFHGEVRDRTWSTLVQTPHSIPQLAADKLCGWTLGIMPSILAPYLMILGMITLHEHVHDVGASIEVLIGSMSFGVAVFGYLHLLVLLSLYYGWKATPLTLTACLAAGWVYFNTLGGWSWSGSIERRCTLYVFTCFVIFGLMFVFQMFTLRRLTELAETA